MDSWNISVFLGWLIFRGELLVSGGVFGMVVLPHMLHGTGIFTYIYHKSKPNG